MRTSFKTHSSSGLVESDWRAIPPKTIKLLFPEVSERGKGRNGSAWIGGPDVSRGLGTHRHPCCGSTSLWADPNQGSAGSFPK